MAELRVETKFKCSLAESSVHRTTRGSAQQKLDDFRPTIAFAISPPRHNSLDFKSLPSRNPESAGDGWKLPLFSPRIKPANFAQKAKVSAHLRFSFSGLHGKPKERNMHLGLDPAKCGRPTESWSNEEIVTSPTR